MEYSVQYLEDREEWSTVYSTLRTGKSGVQCTVPGGQGRVEYSVQYLEDRGEWKLLASSNQEEDRQEAAEILWHGFIT